MRESERPLGDARPSSPPGASSGARGDDGGLETVVVHRPKYDDWSLPKGKPTPGEHLLETAVREVTEETGARRGRGTAQRPDRAIRSPRATSRSTTG